MGANISYNYKTFSGQDSLVFILLPGSKPILLGSLTTLSYSIYRSKKQIMLLNRIDPAGISKGIRVVAGTMVFSLVSEHWIEELKAAIPGLNIERLKADELPQLDLMIVCANEYGASISNTIYGVSFTEEGGVISVEDMFIENTAKYIARDIDNFSAFKYNDSYSSPMFSRYSLGIYNNFMSYNNDNSNSFNTLNSIGYSDEDYKNVVTSFQAKTFMASLSRGYIDSNSKSLLDDISLCKVLNNRIVPVNVYDNKTDLNTVFTLYPFDTVDSVKDSGDYIKTELGYVKKEDLLIRRPYSFEIKCNDSIDITKPIEDNYNIDITDLNSNLNVKYTINKIYDDGYVDTYCKQVKIDSDHTFSLKEFNDITVFNIEHGFPKYIEFIVYPIGYDAIKKVIKIEGV